MILAEFNDLNGSDFRIVQYTEIGFPGEQTRLQLKQCPPIPAEGRTKRGWYIIREYWPRYGFEGSYERSVDMEDNLLFTETLNTRAREEGWGRVERAANIPRFQVGVYSYMNGRIMSRDQVWMPDGDNDAYACIPFGFKPYKLYDPKGIFDAICDFLREFDWDSIRN